MEFFLKWGMRFLFALAALFIVAALWIDMRFFALTFVCIGFACLFGMMRMVFPPTEESFALVVSAE